MKRSILLIAFQHLARPDTFAPTLQNTILYEILHCLEEDGTLWFNEVKQRLAGISPRTLAKSLKQLEGIKLINRRAYAEIPPRVEYSLTERGEKLASILREIWKLFEE